MAPTDNLASAQATPELPTIRQDIAAKARASVELLLELIADERRLTDTRRALDVTLIERASVAVRRPTENQARSSGSEGPARMLSG